MNFRIVSTPIVDEGGEVVAAIELVEDITERLRWEKHLQQAQKMESVGTLAGGIAHDFNNLLYPIIGMAEMLMEDLDPGSIAHENARQIYMAGMRGSELVRQILSFSRQPDDRKAPVKVQQILAEALALIRPAIPSDIRIDVDFDQDCGPVMADPGKLHQVLVNLVTNAYHAVAETRGEVGVRLRETTGEAARREGVRLEAGELVEIEVTDTGSGMDGAVLERIFEPYFTTKAQGKGTGLGLSVVYGIVKDHGGEIKVVSAPGKGSSFKIYLPRVRVTEAPPDTAADGEAGRAGGGARILLVDDEAAIVKLQTRILERLGYAVTSCADGSEALAVFQSDPSGFDLVITDMTMPFKTGDQLAADLLAIRPDIPVIICTGFSERLDREKAEAIGVRELLMKPVARPDLAGAVRRVLDS